MAKSLYISRVVSIFYGTKIGIWAGFGHVSSTEKNGADYEQLLRAVFYVFMGFFMGFIFIFLAQNRL